MVCSGRRPASTGCHPSQNKFLPTAFPHPTSSHKCLHQVDNDQNLSFFMPAKLAHLQKHLHAATALVRAFNLPVSLETFNHFFGLEITTMVNFTTWVVKPLVALAVMARPKNGLQQIQMNHPTPAPKSKKKLNPSTELPAKTHPTGDPPVRRVPPSRKKNVSTEKKKMFLKPKNPKTKKTTKTNGTTVVNGWDFFSEEPE